MLSWKGWHPIASVSYSGYLLHGILVWLCVHGEWIGRMNSQAMLGWSVPDTVCFSHATTLACLHAFKQSNSTQHTHDRYSVLVQVLTAVCGLALVLAVEMPFIRIRKHLGL